MQSVALEVSVYMCYLLQKHVLVLLSKVYYLLTNDNVYCYVCRHAASIQDQLSSYVQQLSSPEHQSWVREAIKKEKLKQQHLQVVIQHLKSEVSSLAKETITQMEESMTHVSVM